VAPSRGFNGNGSVATRGNTAVAPQRGNYGYGTRPNSSVAPQRSAVNGGQRVYSNGTGTVVTAVLTGVLITAVVVHITMAVPVTAPGYVAVTATVAVAVILAPLLLSIP